MAIFRRETTRIREAHGTFWRETSAMGATCYGKKKTGNCEGHSTFWWEATGSCEGEGTILWWETTGRCNGRDTPWRETTEKMRQTCQITAETFMTYNTWDTVEYTTVLLAFRLMFLPVLRQ